jgi:hypothetical protein
MINKGDLVNEKYILEYIRDNLLMCKNGEKSFNNDLFHHNTNYGSAPSVIQNGILSLQQLKDLHLSNISEKSLKLADDTSSHINGKDGISFSKVGLTDLYRDEMEYCPFNPRYVDILVGDIIAHRNSEHYGNEFIAKDSVMPDKFRSVDIRLLEFIRAIENSNNNYSIEELIRDYNYLRKIALVMKENKLDIPLRETSNDANITLDIDSLSNKKELILKR